MLGVWRCSTAWGVTAAPHGMATRASSSSEASGFCKKPRTNVRARDRAVNLRWRTMTPATWAAWSARGPKSRCRDEPTPATIRMGSSFFSITVCC